MQNEYSLLCRLYDTDMAELSHHEDVTLLAFSPLAAGFLTGKYQEGRVPKGSRMSFNTGMGGRIVPRVVEAVASLSRHRAPHGVDLTHMALQWTPHTALPDDPDFRGDDDGTTEPRSPTVWMLIAGRVSS